MKYTDLDNEDEDIAQRWCGDCGRKGRRSWRSGNLLITACKECGARYSERLSDRTRLNALRSTSYTAAVRALLAFRRSATSRFDRFVALEDLYTLIGGPASGLKHVAHLRNTIDKYITELNRLTTIVIHEFDTGTVYQFTAAA